MLAASGSCRDGHMGPRCSECLPDYYRNGSFCHACDLVRKEFMEGLIPYYLIVSILLLLMLLVGGFAIYRCPAHLVTASV